MPDASTSRLGIRSLGRCLALTLRMLPSEILTTLHAVAVISVVEMLIRWVPLPRLSRMLGVRVSLAPATQHVEQLPLAELPPRAVRQLRCTRRVAKVWPFSEGPCLRQSLVVGHLLRDRDAAVRLGVTGTGDNVIAHAWIEIDDRPLESVTGLHVFQQRSGETR